MAALLYQGEYVHARHLWRRHREANPPSYLQDWWKVGASMMTNDATFWQALSHIQTTHPAPLNHYATEVGTAYRKRIVAKYGSPPRQPYWTLLNFASTDEWNQFCVQIQQEAAAPVASTPMAMDSKTSLTQVVAFLGTQPPPSAVGTGIQAPKAASSAGPSAPAAPARG